ncbi:MAG: hypothetical protein AAFV80_09610 [Bacteroidota bacterium]
MNFLSKLLGKKAKGATLILDAKGPYSLGRKAPQTIRLPELNSRPVSVLSPERKPAYQNWILSFI